jgi:RHS repeat-associated protein
VRIVSGRRAYEINAGARQNYLPYGKSAGASIPGSLGYTGQRIDAESGRYDYRARMYHPGWGRFLQPDPLRTITDDLQPGNNGTGNRGNLYGYVGNDPLNMIAPLGLYTLQLGGNFGFTTPLGNFWRVLFWNCIRYSRRRCRILWRWSPGWTWRSQWGRFPCSDRMRRTGQ